MGTEPMSYSGIDSKDTRCDDIFGRCADGSDVEGPVNGVLGTVKLYSLRGVMAKLATLEAEGDGAAQFLGPAFCCR